MASEAQSRGNHRPTAKTVRPGSAQPYARSDHDGRGADGKGSILFVEDDPDTCELVRVILEQVGYQVSIANNRADAESRIREADFDLILLDWVLGDDSGIRLCESIRTFDSEIPIFFYTGIAQPAEIRKALRAGAQGCFIKPVDPNELVGEVSNLLSEK